MRKLYEIDGDLEKLLDENATAICGENAVDTETGEVFNLAERMEALNIERSAKIKGVAVYLDDLNIKLDGLRAKLDKLNKLKKSVDAEIAGYTDWLLFATDKKGYKDDDIECKVKETKQCIIFDDEAVPEKFRKVKTEIAISKMEITKAIKAGETVPGAELRPNYKLSIL